jgi:nucleoside-diphosphate-sugar epimerase
MRILVTGANGFIGSSLCPFLKERGYFVRGSGRSNISNMLSVDEYIQAGNIDEDTDWQEALDRIDIVIHLAGNAHIKHKTEANSLSDFRKINALGTKRLAESAVEAEVKRFIFISSVKVNGGVRTKPYTEDDAPFPEDAYGLSKKEAEEALMGIAKKRGLEVVVLRPPLVYGSGVKANFKSLIKLTESGLPLPFKNVKNRRSFIYLGNLIDVIAVCIEHPKAAGETFMVSDGQDITISDLIRMITKAIGRKQHLFYLPYGILKLLCNVAGKGEEWKKLTGTLIVDSSKIRNLLSWEPPFTLEEGVRETVKHLR